jgi:uncharacterized protein YjiS (DUF1127 family)
MTLAFDSHPVSLNWSGTGFAKLAFLGGRWIGLAALSRLAARILEHFRKQRMIADLGALDDRVLKDIGVTRGEIPHLVHCGRQN